MRAPEGEDRPVLNAAGEQEIRPRSRGGRWAGLGCALLLLVPIAAVLTAPRGPSRPLSVQRLPDGSPVSLEAVTFGREHRLVRGAWWQKHLYPFLPPPLRDRLGADVMDVIPRYPSSICFWTLTGGPAANSSPYRRVVAFNERGCRVEAGNNPMRSDTSMKAPLRTDGWVLSTFPRRGKTVGLLIYEQSPDGHWQRGPKFVTTNPDPGPHPSWAPEPLPASRTQDGLTFTLTSLQGEVRAFHQPGAAGPDEEVWSRSEFRVREKGRTTTEWSPVKIAFSDATGNTWVPSSWSSYNEGETLRYECPNGVCPDEPAYRLRVEFSRNRNFSPAEQATFRPLPLPGPKSVSRSGEVIMRQGYRIELIGISAVNTSMPLAGGSTYTGGEVLAHVRVTPPLAESWRLSVVSAADQRGRDLEGHVRSTSRDGSFALAFQKVPPGARTAVLRVAVHKSRVAEFLAKPAFPNARK